MNPAARAQPPPRLDYEGRHRKESAPHPADQPEGLGLGEWARRGFGFGFAPDGGATHGEVLFEPKGTRVRDRMPE